MKKKLNKFQTGDRIEIVNYGHIAWCGEEFKAAMFPEAKVLNKKDRLLTIDTNPSLIGKKGIIVEQSKCQGNYEYAIKFDAGGYSAWYFEGQISKNYFETILFEIARIFRFDKIINWLS
jgi:hypothetical protein